MPRKSVKSKKLIGLDLDGVILDHTENRIRLAKQLGFEVLPQETPVDILVKKIGIAAYQQMKKMLYENANLARSIPLMPGAKKGLHYLKTIGMPYVLISRRHPPDAAFVSLKVHGLWPDYFETTNAFFVVEKKDKDIKAKALGVTHFVDDEPSVIVELASVPVRFLFDPLGAYSEIPAGSAKVSSWAELLGKII